MGRRPTSYGYALAAALLAAGAAQARSDPSSGPYARQAQPTTLGSSLVKSPVGLGRFAALSRAAFQGYAAAPVEEIRRARNTRSFRRI